jgi:hypothetical protein
VAVDTDLASTVADRAFSSFAAGDRARVSRYTSFVHSASFG